MARLPYVDPEALPEKYEILDECREALPDGVDADYWNTAKTVRVFAHNPELAKMHVHANVSVWIHSGLTPRQVEVVILAVARELNSEFEWHAHSIIAIERAGVDAETVLAIAHRELDEVDEETVALVEYVFEFIRNGGATSDGVHDRLTEYVDDETLIGVAMLAGFYVHLDHVASALGVDHDEEFVGWELENIPDEHERYG